jgi:hypothetical protein
MPFSDFLMIKKYRYGKTAESNKSKWKTNGDNNKFLN